MSNQKITTLILLLLTALATFGQNLPALLTERNIYSTFSIVAYDEKAKEWGIAVATHNIYVGNSTIYIQPGVGAFSVIAETEPRYAVEGFEKLKKGKSIKEAIGEVRDHDNESNYRQVSGIDSVGNVFAFTGQSLKYWQGTASEILGRNYVVMGNQLGEGVLSSMSKTFERTEGPLAERLLASLVAGQNAGGQISGKQSAAIVVKGTNNTWYNQIDLRVDNSANPIEELQTLMHYHYGRIRLNQSLYAIRMGDIKLSKIRLEEAESMLNGWNGIYPKIAQANIALGNEDESIKWIKRGLSENPEWAVYVPAFYCLHHHPEMKSIIKPESFTIKDWESAMIMLSNLGRELEAIELAESLIDKKMGSSYLSFLLGRSYFNEKQKDKAIKHLEQALTLDKDNVEAEELLTKIKH
jgi:uncharacterized Ntn-hydrolase superfamily protein